MATYIAAIIIFFALLLPQASAHGGFQKQAGNTTVYITQTPVSPLVGEQVHLTFVLKQGLNEPLRQLPVTINVIDTFYGDESKDQVMHTEQKQTDFNGAFSFSYTFTKENYFDIDLAFTDPATGREEETGFLIQPRTAPKAAALPWVLTLGGSFLAGLVLHKLNFNKAR